MHAPQRGAYACRMRWIIDADPCKRRLSEPMVKPMVRIHRAAQAICRAKRSLQPFARATAAGPAPPHRRRLPRALPTSSFRHAPAYTWSWGLQSIEPSGSCYKGQCPRTTVRVRASSCSCSEACSCVTAKVSSVGTGSAGVFMSARVFAPTIPRASRVCGCPRPTASPFAALVASRGKGADKAASTQVLIDDQRSVPATARARNPPTVMHLCTGHTTGPHSDDARAMGGQHRTEAPEAE